MNVGFLDTILNAAASGASNVDLTALLQALVSGLTVNVQIGDQELQDIVVEAVVDAGATGALPFGDAVGPNAPGAGLS